MNGTLKMLQLQIWTNTFILLVSSVEFLAEERFDRLEDPRIAQEHVVGIRQISLLLVLGVFALQLTVGQKLKCFLQNKLNFLREE